MRAMTVLLCLVLAACAGNRLGGDVDGQASAAAAGPAASAPPASGSTAPASSSQAPAGQPDSLRIQEARVECWAKVEKQRHLRSIDARIAFVDKCVAEVLNPR
jgi:hypothetical protein